MSKSRDQCLSILGLEFGEAAAVNDARDHVPNLERHAHVREELGTIPALALCGGSALYLSAYVGLRFRVARVIGGGRLIAALVCVALFPVARVVPALAALALVAAVWVALHVYEFVWWREARARIRAGRITVSA